MKHLLSILAFGFVTLAALGQGSPRTYDTVANMTNQSQAVVTNISGVDYLILRP